MYISVLRLPVGPLPVFCFPFLWGPPLTSPMLAPQWPGASPLPCVGFVCGNPCAVASGPELRLAFLTSSSSRCPVPLHLSVAGTCAPPVLPLLCQGVLRPPAQLTSPFGPHGIFVAFLFRSHFKASFVLCVCTVRTGRGRPSCRNGAGHHPGFTGE